MGGWSAYANHEFKIIPTPYQLHPVDVITLRNLHLLTHYLDRVSQALIHQIEYLRVWNVFFGLKGIRPGAS